MTTAFTSLGGDKQDENSGVSSEGLGSSNCDAACEKLMDEKITAALSQISTRSATKKSSSGGTTTIINNTNTQSGTYYIPLSGTGSTTSLDWVEIPRTETEVNWDEYGADKQITWDAYAKVYQGNGKVSLRLYDKTNKVAVGNSELETGSQDSVHLVSGGLSVWAGKNTYVVQAKTATGYEGFFESGRIKIIVN